MGKVDELLILAEELAEADSFSARVVAKKNLRTALSACVAEWLPITDEQCDGRTYIVGRDMGTLGFVRGYGYFFGRPHTLVSGWICRGFTDPPGELGLGHPTHYQPLPPPPTTEGETK